MNKHPIITIHGLFGWGSGELMMDYWGGIFSSSKVPVHECSVGPVSSWYDRACEVIAQIKGLRVDYGAAHSKQYGHKRYGRDYTGKGFYPEWDATNPVHLIGHSAGGNTMRMVQHLLAIDHYKMGSNADWIKSMSAISSVLNGTPVPYILGCDTKTGTVKKGTVGRLLQRLILTAARIKNHADDFTYDFELDHWGFEQTNSIEEDIAALSDLSLFKGNDNLIYDLTFQGTYEANGFMQSYPNTYYFGYATQQTTQYGKYHYPNFAMNPIMMPTSLLAGRYNIEKVAPFPGWGEGRLVNERWYANDGLVPVISQLFPFVNDSVVHSIASTAGITNRSDFEPGTWYYENTTEGTGTSFDHMDIVCGTYLQPATVKPQQQFYADLWKRLGSL